jgi:hypothetical protein
MKEPYDWDEYAQCFFPKAEELAQRASEAEKAGEKDKALELYLFVSPPRPLRREGVYSRPVGGALLSGVFRGSRPQDHQSRSMLGKRVRSSSTRVLRKSQVHHIYMKTH